MKYLLEWHIPEYVSYISCAQDFLAGFVKSSLLEWNAEEPDGLARVQLPKKHSTITLSEAISSKDHARPSLF